MLASVLLVSLREVADGRAACGYGCRHRNTSAEKVSSFSTAYDTYLVSYHSKRRISSKEREHELVWTPKLGLSLSKIQCGVIQQFRVKDEYWY